MIGIRSEILVACAVVAVVFAHGAASLAIGVGVEAGIDTLDLTAAWARVPATAAAAAAAFEAGLIDTGVPPLVVADLVAHLDDILTTVDSTVNDLLTGPEAVVLASFPVPMIGGTFELDLPLIVVDTLRLSAAWLTDSLVWAALDAAGIPLPELPLTIASEDVNLTIDPTFSAGHASIEVTQRLGLLVAAVEIAAGLDWVRGQLDPGVALVVPGFQDAGDRALEALHLDSLSWGVLAATVGLGVEIGPPFLRLYARVRTATPLVTQESTWWPIRTASLAIRVGGVIRF